MKKLFTLMFLIAAMCPLSAEVLSLDVKDVQDAMKEYKFDWPRTQMKGKKPEVILEIDDITAPYMTTEYIKGLQVVGDPDSEEPTPETIITDKYNKRLVEVPAGYLCNAIDGKEETSNGIQINEDSIIFNKEYDIMDSINILIKEKDTPGTFKDVSFKLDYDIVFKDGKYNNKRYLRENAGSDLTDKDLLFTFRYSPDYFTFKEFTSKKEYEKNIEKEVTINYEGKNITLETKTYAVLIVSRDKKNTYYVLEPNFENLYNDFVHVRQGYHTRATVSK